MEIYNIRVFAQVKVFGRLINCSMGNTDFYPTHNMNKSITIEFNRFQGIIEDIICMFEQTPAFKEGKENYEDASINIDAGNVYLKGSSFDGYYTQDSLESYLEDLNLISRL